MYFGNRICEAGSGQLPDHVMVHNIQFCDKGRFLKDFHGQRTSETAPL